MLLLLSYQNLCLDGSSSGPCNSTLCPDASSDLDTPAWVWTNNQCRNPPHLSCNCLLSVIPDEPDARLSLYSSFQQLAIISMLTFPTLGKCSPLLHPLIVALADRAFSCYAWRSSKKSSAWVVLFPVAASILLIGIVSVLIAKSWKAAA